MFYTKNFKYTIELINNNKRYTYSSVQRAFIKERDLFCMLYDLILIFNRNSHCCCINRCTFVITKQHTSNKSNELMEGVNCCVNNLLYTSLLLYMPFCDIFITKSMTVEKIKVKCIDRKYCHHTTSY